ncbi:MAG: AraC family transcriptional regulator [Pseudomonadota bacterium]
MSGLRALVDIYVAYNPKTVSYNHMDTDFILNQMETVAEPFALCQLHGNGELGLDKTPSATLHYVLAGRGEIILPGQKPIELQKGSLILIPALSGHVIRSFGKPGDPLPVCRPAELNLANFIDGDEGQQEEQLIAICSRVSLSLRSLHNLIDLVRVPIVQNVNDESFLALPIQAILHELAAPGPGSMAMIRTLLLACTIDMLRQRLATGDESLRWMSALRDTGLWTALQHMLDAPGEDHSLESLATVSGMSRSTFAKRFADAYGSGPMELLRDLRMQRAAANLIETDIPVKRIAEMSGFRSRSAFTRAFEATTGASPQAFRINSRAK